LISLTIARKYARAFLEVGRTEGNHELLGKELEKFMALLQEKKELKRVLFSPFYPGPKRKAIARIIGDSLGLSKSTLDFIDLLVERERIDYLPAIVKSYEELCDNVSNRIRASLTSAVKLPAGLVKEIQKELGSLLGKEVLLSTLEDSSLIGGVVIKIGNTIYDGSLKTQLLRARENLSKE